MPTPKYIQRAYTLLRKYSYHYDLVERSNGRVSRDFCGFADIIAFRPITGQDCVSNPELLNNPEPWQGCLAVQVCRYTDFAEHRNKIDTPPQSNELHAWLSAGNRFEIWAFPTTADKRVKGKKYLPKIARYWLSNNTYAVSSHSELDALGYVSVEKPRPKKRPKSG